MDLLVLFLIALVLLQFIISSIQVPLYINVLIIILAFLLFVYSRIFRMASIEVEKMEDRSYLVGILASVTSIISITIAIIAVVRGG